MTARPIIELRNLAKVAAMYGHVVIPAKPDSEVIEAIVSGSELPGMRLIATGFYEEIVTLAQVAP